MHLFHMFLPWGKVLFYVSNESKINSPENSGVPIERLIQRRRDV